MSGFAKLFSSIITSSIWAEDDKVLRVWIAMLASCDADGIVEGSIPGFANLCRVTITEMENVLQVLSSPDPYSRTKTKEGRRIEAFDGGWSIINYPVHREKPQGKEGSRAPYMRKYRESLQAVTRNTDKETEADQEVEDTLSIRLSSAGQSSIKDDLKKQPPAGASTTVAEALPNAYRITGSPIARVELLPEDSYCNPWNTVEVGWNNLRVEHPEKKPIAKSKKDSLQAIVEQFSANEPLWALLYTAAICFIRKDPIARANSGVEYLFKDGGKILFEYAGKFLSYYEMPFPIMLDGELWWANWRYAGPVGRKFIPDPHGDEWQCSDLYNNPEDLEGLPVCKPFYSTY